MTRAGFVACALGAIVTAYSCAPAAGPPSAVTPTCAGPVADTSGWTRTAFERSVSLLLPASMRRDTSAMAELTFYHGGGRYADKHIEVTVYYLDAKYYPGLPPHFDTLPGSPACWITPGWLTRLASPRERRGTAVQVWYRRPASAQRWLMLYIESDRKSDSLTLMALALAAKPDTLFWQ